MAKQVNRSHYGSSYAHPARWLAYGWQIKCLEQFRQAAWPAVLVIGVGDKVVPDYLVKTGWAVTTVDIDAELLPDKIGDVRRLPFPDGSFDAVLCAEVLEHIPWADLPMALAELQRVTRRGVVLSLPDARRTLINFQLKLPYLPTIKLFWQIGRRQKAALSAQHYWEIGRPGFALTTVRQALQSGGLRLTDEFTQAEVPTMRFFILEK